MFEAYNALDVLVLSSLSEGFPNAVAEAMACGIPCVVTRAGDAGEIVGETGTVVDPRDAFSLARGVAGILADGPPPPRTDARDRIVRLYGLDTMLDRMEELFTGLVEESAR